MSEKGGERGSVLMEFIIVAPLYFLLLGGLFMVGGLGLNRIRMHVGDHLVTWVGGSRFCPTESGSQSGDAEKSWKKVKELTSQLFECPIGGMSTDDEGFEVKRPDDEPTRVNDFMGLYFGGITRLPVNVPSWVRGMMGMQGAMTRDGNSEWFLMETAEYDCGHDRAYSFHRMGLDFDSKNGGSDSLPYRSKFIRASDVVSRGYLESVLNENWIGSSSSQRTTVTIGAAQEFPKGRMLGRFGE